MDNSIFDASSDDESDQLNRIREKLNNRLKNDLFDDCVSLSDFDESSLSEHGNDTHSHSSDDTTGSPDSPHCQSLVHSETAQADQVLNVSSKATSNSALAATKNYLVALEAFDMTNLETNKEFADEERLEGSIVPYDCDRKTSLDEQQSGSINVDPMASLKNKTSTTIHCNRIDSEQKQNNPCITSAPIDSDRSIHSSFKDSSASTHQKLQNCLAVMHNLSVKMQHQHTNSGILSLTTGNPENKKQSIIGTTDLNCKEKDVVENTINGWTTNASGVEVLSPCPREPSLGMSSYAMTANNRERDKDTGNRNGASVDPPIPSSGLHEERSSNREKDFQARSGRTTASITLLEPYSAQNDLESPNVVTDISNCRKEINANHTGNRLGSQSTIVDRILTTDLRKYVDPNPVGGEGEPTTCEDGNLGKSLRNDLNSQAMVSVGTFTIQNPYRSRKPKIHGRNAESRGNEACDAQIYDCLGSMAYKDNARSSQVCESKIADVGTMSLSDCKAEVETYHNYYESDSKSEKKLDRVREIDAGYPTSEDRDSIGCLIDRSENRPKISGQLESAASDGLNVPTSKDDAHITGATELSIPAEPERVHNQSVYGQGFENEDTGRFDNVLLDGNEIGSFDGYVQLESDVLAPRSNNSTVFDEMHEMCNSEVHPSLYAPLSSKQLIEPIIHKFTRENRPLAARPMLRVSELYASPVDRFWKSSFESFNHLQSEMGNILSYSDDNVVVSAPTGAGKTAVFEMAMGRFFTTDLTSFHYRRSHSTNISKSRKIVYMSPSKALCEERFKDWSSRLTAMNLGIEIAVVTGDGDPSETFRHLASAHVILTTPEKWDSITRRWTENFVLFSSFKLFMIDEVHLIADENRGCCLESVVCRMKTIQRAASNVKMTQEDIATSSYSNGSPEAINQVLRIIAVSATLPNISDIASFIEANEAYTFDESYRPVPLTTHVIGQGMLGEKSAGHYHFWKNLDRCVPDIIRRFSNNRPTIVFCHSKADTEKLADLLATAYNIGRRDIRNSEVASKTRVSKLQRVLLYGVAYHHAGLEGDDRKLVERNFVDGRIQVLCATTTLAMGVNLPAHLVVVKGTKAWRGAGSGYQDLDQATLLQMIGRAGRLGFDTAGTAVIMTDNESKSVYERLASSGLRPASSQLQNKLIETINAEISQQVVTNAESAVNWVKTTLFYIQLMKDPAANGVQIVSRHSIDTHILHLCTKSINFLRSVGAVLASDGQEFRPRPACHIMSQHLVEHQAMELIANIPHDASQRQVLQELAKIEGLQYPVRRSDKKFLNEAHKQLKMHKLEGPISKVRVQEPWEKSFVLLQAFIDDVNFDGNFVLRQEATSMTEFASRMLAAIEEYSIRGSKHGNLIFQTIKLRRSLALRQWNCQDGMLLQIQGISKTMSFSLHLAGISNFDDVLKHEDTVIERIAGRAPPFGADLLRIALNVSSSRLQIRAAVKLSEDAGSASCIKINLIRRPVIENVALTDVVPGVKSPEVSYALVVCSDNAGGCLLFHPKVTGPGMYEAPIPPRFQKITIHLIATMAGLDEKVEIPGNIENALPSRSPSKKGNTDVNVRRIRDFTRPQVLDARNDSGGKDLKVIGTRCLLGASSEPIAKSSSSTVTPSPKPSVAAAAKNVLTGEYNSNRNGIPLNFCEKSSLGLRNANKQDIHPRLRAEYDSIVFQEFPLKNPDATEFEASYFESLSSQGIERIARNIAEPVKHVDSYTSDYSRKRQQIDFAGPFPGIERIARNIPEPVKLVDSHTSDFSRKRQQIDFAGPFPTTTAGVAWKRNKRQQISTQRRAFTRRADNPFSLYKHDPNDTESYLNDLSNRSSATKDSLIPEEGLRVLENTYTQAGSREVRHQANRLRSTRQAFTSARVRNRHLNDGTRLSNQELLALKAAEQNAYLVQSSPQLSSWEFQSEQSQPYYQNLADAGFSQPSEHSPPLQWPGHNCVSNCSHQGSGSLQNFLPSNFQNAQDASSIYLNGIPSIFPNRTHPNLQSMHYPPFSSQDEQAFNNHFHRVVPVTRSYMNIRHASRGMVQGGFQSPGYQNRSGHLCVPGDRVTELQSNCLPWDDDIELESDAFF